MDVNVLREAIRATPFQPFRLRLADGRELAVSQPEVIAISPNGSGVVWFAADDAMSLVNASTIVSLEPAPPSSSAGP